LLYNYLSMKKLLRIGLTGAALAFAAWQSPELAGAAPAGNSVEMAEPGEDKYLDDAVLLLGGIAAVSAAGVGLQIYLDRREHSGQQEDVQVDD
jgi:hypothetical protein